MTIKKHLEFSYDYTYSICLAMLVM